MAMPPPGPGPGGPGGPPPGAPPPLPPPGGPPPGGPTTTVTVTPGAGGGGGGGRGRRGGLRWYWVLMIMFMSWGIGFLMAMFLWPALFGPKPTGGATIVKIAGGGVQIILDPGQLVAYQTQQAACLQLAARIKENYEKQWDPMPAASASGMSVSAVAPSYLGPAASGSPPNKPPMYGKYLTATEIELANKCGSILVITMP